MPLLDVSHVLTHPDIADRFTVNRRSTSTNSHGRVEKTVQQFKNVVGVVCAASGNDMERHPDIQFMGRNLSIVTHFRLTGPANGVQPDIIEWRGNFFVVVSLDPYPQYGTGFVQAIVSSIDSMDAVLEQPAPSNEVFGGVASSD